ncbi:hypothetical protein [Streptomyces sp. NPDC015125]|uniref:hypothetical protein n=1 Tax=Streptomyces sp. NPDC015125 TaxID=3364938 RepID=UPI0036FD4D13
MFVEVMVTSALSPMRVVGSFRSLIAPTGTIGVMSSRQGSVSLNSNGGQDVYRAGRSALNRLMRNYAARYADAAHTHSCSSAPAVSAPNSVDRAHR